MQVLRQADVDPDAIARFNRDVEVMASFRRPAVLGLRGYSPVYVDTDPGGGIVVDYMKWGKVGDLMELERKGRAPRGWDLTHKLIVLFGAAVGMRALHENRIVHNAFGDQAVLVNENFEPKVSRFGRAVYFDTEKCAFKRTNYPLYMAPEIVRGEFGFPVDVYAFGMLAYQMVTGIDPTPEVDADTFRSGVVEGERPAIPTTTPRGFAELIERCWHQDPKQRPTFDDIVKTMRSGKARFGPISVDEFRRYCDGLLLTEKKIEAPPQSDVHQWKKNTQHLSLDVTRPELAGLFDI
jgi:serine/threonine protein kinase